MVLPILKRRIATKATMSRLARPPYIDTTTGIAYDTDKAEFEGYLTKQSMWLRVRIVYCHDIFFSFDVEVLMLRVLAFMNLSHTSFIHIHVSIIYTKL